ncbi:MAG: ATP-binding protein [Syntrophorhabdales bacterium]|jgi:PAS domain S-box-containing protein
MPLSSILKKHRDEIIGEWVRRLHDTVSARYNERPLEELKVTVSVANNANHAVLVHDDYSLLNGHIEWISNLRLYGGFSLSEVQNAYELYRSILVPILLGELSGEELLATIRKLNECLFYTITRFSNYFQSLHEAHIREHARDLEKKVEERTRELAESESKYRVLVEEISDGYFVVQDGVIVFANRAYCDLHGYSLKEIIGKPYTELIAPRSLPAVARLYKKRMAGAEAKDLYAYFRRDKSGRSRPTENKVKSIPYDGHPAVAGICRDITERMETEKRMREAERFAYIGKLTTSLAHEIRNPLCSVKLNSQILLKNTAFDGNDKRRLEIVVHEISRLERILDEMLDYAKPLNLKMQPGSLKKIIDSCLDTMEVRIREKGIEVKRRYSDHRVRRLLFDGEKIEQALINVLINCLDALEKGGSIEINTKVVSDNGMSLRLEISDNGPGIPSEDLPFVFDPFFSRKKGGTGLGLGNVKKIVEAHGGRVDLVPRKPTGTILGLTLPMKEVLH